MTYFVETRWGGSEESPSKNRMIEIINELDVRDQEHPDTWLTHKSGWTLTIHEKGIVNWKNIEEEHDARHIKTTDKALMHRLWMLLSEGKIEELHSLNWSNGHGIPPQTPEERLQIENAIAELNKKWYSSLGPEDPSKKCAEIGCRRGTIRNSVLCRSHHYEMIKKSRCPYNY